MTLAISNAKSLANGLTERDTNSNILYGSIGCHKNVVTSFNICKLGRAKEADKIPRLGSPS